MPPKRGVQKRVKDAKTIAQKPKTERTHAENQERAYIAASRRSDRSLEARIVSAQHASEIHHKRCGKPFRITEDIVRDEEMYEEEEDEYPRSYRLLGPHLQTQNPGLNTKLEAYMSSRLAIRSFMNRSHAEWQENEVNSEFATAFPNYAQFARDLQPPNRSASQGTLTGLPLTPELPQTHSRTGSLPQMSRTDSNNGYVAPSSSFAFPTPASTEGYSPSCPNGLGNMNTVPPFGSAKSAFTNELPQEMKLMMAGPGNFGMTNLFNQGFSYNQSSTPTTDMTGTYDSAMAGANKGMEFDQSSVNILDGNWDAASNDNKEKLPTPTDMFSGNWTPAPENVDWNEFINDDQFDNNQDMQFDGTQNIQG